jgi:predicted RNase H-like HicB family nuclease
MSWFVLPFLAAIQGKTVPEALANIREAIDLCIEDMESRGEEIPDPNNVLIGSVVVTR